MSYAIHTRHPSFSNFCHNTLASQMSDRQHLMTVAACTLQCNCNFGLMTVAMHCLIPPSQSVYCIYQTAHPGLLYHLYHHPRYDIYTRQLDRISWLHQTARGGGVSRVKDMCWVCEELRRDDSTNMPRVAAVCQVAAQMLSWFSLRSPQCLALVLYRPLYYADWETANRAVALQYQSHYDQMESVN